MIKNNKIELFENGIVVDNKLPKHNMIDNDVEYNNTVILGDGDTLISSSGVWVPTNDGDTNNDKTYKRRFINWLLKILNGSEGNKKPLSLGSLVLFFNNIKQNVNKLQKKNIDDILDSYVTILNDAKKNNQTALIEKINRFSYVLGLETLLSTSKFNKYLNESDIVKFYNIASKHEKYETYLKLTYIKNFVKIIPNEVTKLKEKADELKVFDNYVILHYDYQNNGVEDTEEEKRRKKDPILFGVIKNSNRLYYIGDWIDDYCDLTLDTVLSKLDKKDVDVLNKKTVIKNLNNSI